MTLQLQHVFAGKGIWAGEPQRNALVQRRTVAVFKWQVIRVARFWQFTQHRFGHLAQVFSTYEGTVAAGGAPIRGINSIQLMHDGRRWWIVSLAWAPETASQPLPQAYLPADADTR